MALHPNSLPESKEYYVRSLTLRRYFYSRLAEQAADIVIVMYHAEVPYARARQFTSELARQGYRAPGSPQSMPSQYVQDMLVRAGASSNEAAQFTAVLDAKRFH